MTGLIALLDANILYPAPVRDIFLQLSADNLFRAKWTAEIHREWINALLRNEPHRDRAALERTRDLMDRATLDCLVAGYETLIPTLELPDPGDRHVLAAAIVGHCDLIVTFNTKDFPETALAPFGIDVLHPDIFLARQLDLAPDAFSNAIRKILSRLVAPPISTQEYLAILSKLGLVTTASALAEIPEWDS